MFCIGLIWIFSTIVENTCILVHTSVYLHLSKFYLINRWYCDINVKILKFSSNYRHFQIIYSNSFYVLFPLVILSLAIIPVSCKNTHHMLPYQCCTSDCATLYYYWNCWLHFTLQFFPCLALKRAPDLIELGIRTIRINQLLKYQET